MRSGRLSAVLPIAIIVLIIVTGTTLAATTSQSVASSYGFFSGFPIVKIVVDGNEVRGDVPGLILSGRTMVPVRFVSEALGADVKWDQSTLTVEISSRGGAAQSPSVPPQPSYGSYAGFPIVRITVNGKTIQSDVPGVILNGRTMVPVRFVSEALAADVAWDQATSTVGIKSKAPATATINHVFLSAVHVTEDWMLFTDTLGGWPGAIENKETNGVKFYEAAMWDDGLSIHLYAFPNDFNPLFGDLEGLSAQERVAYRESFCVFKVAGMPVDVAQRGPFVLDAFKQITALLVDRHPKATHHLTYLGHGGAGGELFALHMNRREASDLLAHWSSSLGRRLGVIDMGMPCSKGSFQDLEIYHEYAQYYVASDLDICGALPDDESQDYRLVDWLYNYPRLLSSHATLEEALMARIDIRRLELEAGRIARTADKDMQSMYLYSCTEFGLYKDAISSFMKAQSLEGLPFLVDMKTFMENSNAGPELLAGLEKIIIYGVDTRDFFPWSEDWNGLTWCNFGYDH